MPTANLMGRGILPAQVEARLAARGIVHAEWVPRASGRGWRLTTCRRPLGAALADTLMDAGEQLLHLPSVASNSPTPIPT